MENSPAPQDGQLQMLAKDIVPTVPPGSPDTKLSRDIWLLIFDYFRDGASLTFKTDDFQWPTERPNKPHNLLSLRSTCRTLKAYIDPILCPIVYLDLNKQSMKHIENMASNPAIAGGVRAVEIDLSFFRPSFGEDFRLLCARVRHFVKSIKHPCEFLRGYGDHSGGYTCLVEIECDKIVAILDEFVNSLEASVDNRVEGAQIYIDDDRYHKLFTDRFAWYRQQSREQQAILKDSSFVATLALAISRFKHPIHLAFNTKKGDAVPSRPHDHPGALALLHNEAQLLRCGAWPSRWMLFESRIYNSSDADAERLPVQVLTELPIACNRAGAPIHSLSIHLRLPPALFDLLLQGNTNSQDLTEACRGLQMLNIGKCNTSPLGAVRADHFHGEIRSPWFLGGGPGRIFDACLGAMCSGPRLKLITLDLAPVDAFLPATHCVDIKRVISAWTSTTMTRISLSYVTMTSTDLENLICTLPTTIQHLELTWIHLSSGKFARSVRLLREKVTQIRDAEDRSLDMRIALFKGGEFGDLWTSHATWTLVRKVRAYVYSKEDTNPLGGEEDDE